MKRAIIVHCWSGIPDYCWYPQTKRELEKEGFNVQVPEMPETDAPEFSRWLKTLQDAADAPDKELYLIGHSLGCVTIMRYLEALPKGAKVGGVVFVAGFTDDLGYKELKSFFETPLDLKRIKLRAGYFVDIYSDNDPYVPIKHAEVLQEKLGAALIFKPGLKHFSGPAVYEESCISLPEVSQAILKKEFLKTLN